MGVGDGLKDFIFCFVICVVSLIRRAILRESMLGWRCRLTRHLWFISQTLNVWYIYIHLQGGGNSNIFLFSPRKLGKMNPVWRSYFSHGLVQPPTRNLQDGQAKSSAQRDWKDGNISYIERFNSRWCGCFSEISHTCEYDTSLNKMMDLNLSV